MATDRQERARKRNWLKATVIGGFSGVQRAAIDHVTKEEMIIFRDILRLRDKLIANWDKNTEALGMKVNPKKRET